VDCVIGIPSFIQVNASGGEPREVQDNVRGELTMTTRVDDNGGSIVGATV